MNEFQIALLIGAVIASFLSLRLPRAQLWILTMAAAFIFPTVWQRADLPFHPAITLGCDAGVCLAIYFLGLEKWEIGLYRIFQASVLTSLIFLAGPLEVFGAVFHMGNYGYVVLLEAWNWLALLLIGGVGLSEMLKGRADENASGYRGRADILGPVRSWRTARQSQPFHKVRK
jgi:hypothetical protein